MVDRPPNPKPCARCGGDNSKRDRSAIFCWPCAREREKDTGAYWAYRELKKAITRGDLPRACTLPCTDCGKQARDWDHRDYSKPLEVVPVCRSCNKLRGPAIPLVAKGD